MVKNYKIFISHSWSHLDDLENLRGLLEKRGYFGVEFEEVAPDNAIDSEYSNYIKSVLKSKINNSDIVLGIAGMYASYSDWMEWEMKMANSLGIKVIGVIPRGQTRISQTVTKYSEENVGWSTESIVMAVREYSK